VDLDPIRIEIGRPGVEITERSLKTQYNAIALADVTAKIDTARLFIGLLKEQDIKATQDLPYTIRYADWLPNMLTSALADPSGLLLDPYPDSWEVKAHALYALEGLRCGPKLMDALGYCLQDPHWPVRFQAAMLIAAHPTTGFEKVLAWTAKHDVHPLVRSLATLLAERAHPTSNP
jgi:hypothetical protein